jgi:DNA mismatch endonuclease (patch repair protein)
VLPGDPDIVLKKHKKVVFVNGCFWHGHRGCKRADLPSSNCVFWKNKIAGNMKRDKQVLRDLKKLGWKSLVIWTCRVKDRDKLTKMIDNFMSLD